MTTKTRLQKLERQIDKMKQALGSLGEMRPGSLSRQYNVCGKPGCRCKDKAEPRKHGPYYQLSYVDAGRSTSQFIKVEFVAQTRQQIENYRQFKRLTEAWSRLALRHAKLRIQIEKQAKKS